MWLLGYEGPAHINTLFWCRNVYRELPRLPLRQLSVQKGPNLINPTDISSITSYCSVVGMCWPLVAEEPHRSPILNLEHCPLKANVSCLIFPLHQGKMSSTQPLSGLDSPSQGSRGQLTSTPPYRSPPSLFPFKIGKATRAHPALASAIFSLTICRGLVAL